MPSPLDALDFPFMRTALAEILLLAVAGGLLGAWVVLRRLAFFTHAVGTATFPGLVAATAAGISPELAGLAVGLGYAGGVGRARGDDATTGLLLTAALAGGVVLASDVLHSGAAVDRLLFGTLVGLNGADIAFSAAAAAAAIGATALLGRAWLASGFDEEGARAAGVPARALDTFLLLLIAAAVVISLPAVGALLAASLFVVPAATARLFARSMRSLAAWSVVIAAVVGAVGLYVAYWANVSPGPAVAACGGAVYALAALVAHASRTPVPQVVR